MTISNMKTLLILGNGFCISRTLTLDKFQFVAGQRGKPKLVIEGNTFFRTKGDGNRSYWSCSKYKSQGCKCKVITKENSMVVKFTFQYHSHEPELLACKRDIELKHEPELLAYKREIELKKIFINYI